MRCKITNFLPINQIFFVILHSMKGYIKYLGLFSVALGLVLFAVHILASVKGNALLLTGLAMVIGGTIAHVRLQK
ncbi:hypothetical protein HMPREF3226_01109 [Prevotella corporis]|uniref:Uncharacterized protein n=1 Tax=Prevotella corporis TaxID=28128 RepID=A0A133QAM9_9BACT|nr:hypothetical protein HMPREF3226_01109 [Prevotella corporis]